MLTQKTLITKYERPNYFQDVMLEGAFRSFEHDYHFIAADDGDTIMRDVIRFAAPFGLFGLWAERLLLLRHLEQFLR